MNTVGRVRSLAREIIVWKINLYGARVSPSASCTLKGKRRQVSLASGSDPSAPLFSALDHPGNRREDDLAELLDVRLHEGWDLLEILFRGGLELGYTF